GVGFSAGSDSFSHITFFNTGSTPAVPEPTTWAMMLLGFGFVGGVMRSVKRRQKMTFSYA
ncbi:PEP-CTERM sorting domain-containing protein, partial [Altererythrobacter sp. SALINAS58]|uniref:PEPxxWA-CTERM sorting domain-containing protein n=1 Tax=Alteripontixanthobacter muriae TaxID=2705546 RepID=UPI001575D7DD